MVPDRILQAHSYLVGESWMTRTREELSGHERLAMHRLAWGDGGAD